MEDILATFDLVFEGGGAKGIALAGGIDALNRRGHTIGRVIGTSAGAITATNLVLGYSGEEIFSGALEKTADGKSIYSTFADVPKLSDGELERSGLFRLLREAPLPVSGRFEDKLDLAIMHGVTHVPALASLVSLFELGGLFRGDAFLAWMTACLERKGFKGATLGDLHAATGRDLSIVATDTANRRLLVLNHRTAPNLPVVWAVRMSMSIPFYWQEVRWDRAWGTYRGQDLTGCTIVDGGVVSNFPLFLLTDHADDEVRAVMGDAAPTCEPLGFYLDPTLEVPGSGSLAPAAPDAVSPTRARIEAILDTLMSARDNVVFDAHKQRVVRLPVRGYGTTEFEMSAPRAKALFDAAVVATNAWLDAAK
jgi:NTE family protein